MSKISRQDRARYRAGYREQQRRIEAARHARKRERVIAIKLASACVDCGWKPTTAEETKLLYFDHRDPATKTGTSNRRAFNYSWSWSRISAELALCDTRCKPCHRARSSREGHLTITH